MKTFTVYLQPIQLLNYTLEVAKPGRLPAGKTEIPFELPVKAKGNKELYETYHGVFVNIQVQWFPLMTSSVTTSTKL